MYSDLDLKEMAIPLKIKLNGVLCKDKLTSVKQGGYIINMQSSVDCETGERNTGSHWIALYITKNKAYYCDSFGLPPPEEILTAIKNRSLIFNDVQIQNINSYYCGLYALIFLYFMQHGYGLIQNRMLKYQSNFKQDTRKNLKILKSNYIQLTR